MRIQCECSDSAVEEIDRLVEILNLRCRGRLVEMGISHFKRFQEEIKQGGKIFIKKQNGEIVEVEFVIV